MLYIGAPNLMTPLICITTFSAVSGEREARMETRRAAPRENDIFALSADDREATERRNGFDAASSWRATSPSAAFTARIARRSHLR